MLKYIEDNFKVEAVKNNQLWFHKRGLMETSTGYGKKLRTEKMLKIGSRWHRLYCCIFGNCGTCYIIKNSAKYYLKYDETVQ